MSKMVNLSKKSQQLIEQYIALGGTEKIELYSDASSVERSTLVNWLAGEQIIPTDIQKKSQKEMEFVLTSLRTELLRDLLNSMGEALTPEEKPPSKAARWKFYLIATCGALVAACEGFDSISTLLGVMALPSAATLAGGIAFAALSVMVFYGFNLAQVSKNLGVKLTDAPKLLDLYLLQMNEIKGIRKKLSKVKLTELSSGELHDLEHMITMLQKRLDGLVETSKQFDTALRNPKIKIAKNIFSGIAGLLFFGGGFFAGQSVAVFLLSLGLTGITATAWPVVAIAVVVGLAAFSLYWYVEKVGLQQLISGLLGLDEEKIDQLCNQEKVNKQSQKLANLKEQVVSATELTEKMELMQQKTEDKQDEDAPLSSKKNPQQKIGYSSYSFYHSAEEEEIYAETQESELRLCL